MKNISYSGVVLDNASKNKLVEYFKSIIPLGFEIIAHHMTIKLGALDENSEAKRDMINNKIITLNVVDYAINNLVFAVGVDGYPSNNVKPHITIAVNRVEGGKPYMSNKLTDWKPLKNTIRIQGIVMEI
jgi:hypothetical protein